MLYNPTSADPQLNKQDLNLSAVIFTCFQGLKFVTLFLLLSVVDTSNRKKKLYSSSQTDTTIHSTLDIIAFCTPAVQHQGQET